MLSDDEAAFEIPVTDHIREHFGALKKIIHYNLPDSKYRILPTISPSIAT